MLSFILNFHYRIELPYVLAASEPRDGFRPFVEHEAQVFAGFHVLVERIVVPSLPARLVGYLENHLRSCIMMSSSSSILPVFPRSNILKMFSSSSLLLLRQKIPIEKQNH